MSPRRFSFVLPSDWWRVPLADEQARTAGIERMVDHQFPNIDEAAQLRHDITEELQKQSVQSASVGGLVTAFYLLNLEGTPIAATMTSYDVSGLMSLPSEIDPVKLLAHYVGDTELDSSLPDLSEAFRSEGDAPHTSTSDSIPSAQQIPDEEPPQEVASTPAAVQEDEPWVKVADYDIVAYRREYIDPGTDYFGEDTPKVEQLQVAYAQVVPNFGLVHTVFSTPVIQARDAWIKMFDAMVATFRASSPEEPLSASATAAEPHQEI